MDRSVEVRLRMDISNFMRNAGSAGREVDALIARLALLDAQMDRINASSVAAGTGMRDARAQVRGMGRDADRAAPGIMNAQAALDAFNRSAGVSSTRMGVFRTNSRGMSRQLDQDGRSIDRLSGRLGLAVDGVLTLGSALIPMGALAGQGAAGLAAMGAAALVAGGSMLLAFQGVTDAVKAVQEYQDDPSQANLEKARAELDKMSPAARQFVTEFQKARPILSDLQDAAAEGWLPGFTEALDQLDVVAPKLEKILTTTGQMGGALIADSAESLASDRWTEFYDFLADEVPSAMASTTRIMGDLAHGASEMWMAFDPGNDSFIAWVEDVANGFDHWASSADGREDIEGFLAYARENGPAVAEFFAATGGALLGIVQAAAPLGGPTLMALTAVAEVVEMVADSDMATPILAAVAALRLFNRVAAITQSSAIIAPFRSGTAAPAVAAAAAGARVNTTNLPPHLQGAAAAPHPSVIAAQQRAERRSAMLRGGGMAAGVGLLASGAASDLNLTNTAMLTLAGSMAGPVGAALGAVAGASMDAAAANDGLTESLTAAGAALNSGDFATGASAVADARAELRAFSEEMAPRQGTMGALKDSFDLGKVKNQVEGWFGGSTDVEDAADELKLLESQQDRNAESARDLGRAIGMQIGPLDDSARSTAELQRALDAARPAMDALGITAEDLANGSRLDDWAKGGENISPLVQLVGESFVEAGLGADELNSKIDAWIDNADSAAERTENYRTVLRSLAADEGTASEQADRFREAMDQLVSPVLDAEAALSGQRDVLQDLKEMNADGGFTQANEVGRQNLAITRGYTAAVKERIATMIGAGRSEKDIARALATSREQFIASGTAAGFSARQMRRRADAIGLTPKLVTTTFRALGIGAFEQQVQGIRNLTKGVPKRVLTDIATNGVPKTQAEIEALLGKYKLTEKQRTAILALIDRASGQIPAALAALARYDGKSATSYLYKREITILETRYSGSGAGSGALGRGAQPSADGSTVPGGGPYTDRFPYMLAPLEEVVSNRRGQADRYRGVLKAINANADPETVAGLILPMGRRAANGVTAGRGATTSVGRLSGSRGLSLHLTGHLDTPWGPAQLRDLVVDTTRAELDADRRFEAAHG